MNVLFLSHRLPYAPNRGDRLRAYHMLREMQSWAEIHLLSLVHDDEEASHVEETRAFTTSTTIVRARRWRGLLSAVSSLPTARPVTHAMLSPVEFGRALQRIARAHKPDVVVAYCTGIAPFAEHPAIAGTPLVLDMVDVDSAKWEALGRTARWPMSWIYRREANVLSRFERQISETANRTLVVTRKEASLLQHMAPAARITVLGNGVDTDQLRPPPAGVEKAPAVVFVGVMDYPPNVEGVIWLAQHVWPLVRRLRADARLEIVGSSPTAAVRALATPASGITVTGRVADVRPYLWSATVSAAPLKTARGVQNKVLEAIAAGLPAVVTPQVYEGLPVEVRPACSVASEAEAFAHELVSRLSDSPEANNSRVLQADVQSLGWKRQLEPLRRILVEAASSVKTR